MSTLLGIFAKHWTPGRVKTRLAEAIGDARAAEVHRLFVTAIAQRMGAASDERILAIDPPESEHEFGRALGDSWQVEPQAAGDLGERMAAFFAGGLARAGLVVLIGSDSPDLPADYIADAFEALREVDVVLGPAADGGYYLVGAARRVPPIFTGISWSTADVWPQTVRRLTQAGCQWRSLPQWYDVDTFDDLRQLRFRLKDASSADRSLHALACRLSELFADSPP